MTAPSSPYQFAIRDIVNSIVDEYARKHKPASGQLGLFEKPEERQKPLFSKKVDNEAGRWVTMRGARVFISGEDGRIMKGPKRLMGKTREQIEQEGSAGKGEAPKPKPLAELGRIKGGRADNRQKKLFEELNPGFKFDEDDDVKTVAPAVVPVAAQAPPSPADDVDPISALTDNVLHLRPGHRFEQLQLSLGVNKPAMGKKGTKNVQDALRKIPGGNVIAAMLATGSEHGSLVEFDSNGFPQIGNDAFQRAVDGKFSREDLNAAKEFLETNYSNSTEFGNVNQYRWLSGVASVAKPKPAEKNEEPTFSLSSTPAPAPAKSADFGKSDSTKQGALFDTGKNTKDLKGQELLFNSDAGDLNNPKTMENKAQAKDDGPQDGDKNETGLTFRNGRWHRDGQEIYPADIAAKARGNGENIWTAAKRELGVNSMGEIPPALRKELGDAMAATSAGKAPEVKPPSPGRQKAMEKQEAKQKAEESPAVPVASPTATRGGVKDFGEYIPGSRKERAKKLGPREKKEDSEGDKEKKPGWKNRYSVSEIASSSNRSEVGKFHVTDSRSKDYFGQNKSLGVFSTREEAEAAVPQLEVNRNHSIRRINEGQPKDQAEWDKYVEAKNAWAKRFETATAEEARKIPFPDRPERVGEEYAIVRNVSDKKRPTVKGGFSSQAEAEKWMKENPESIIEHQFPSYETYQYLDRVERSGPEFRKSNVDPEDFQKAFKTHGGQFGKWNSGKDGQTSLNHAYDSFHDLADVLGVSPEAISLNGKLAMAFGARGTGGKDSARAHYEPALDVINLTKMKGAGSLAHEWAHALDFGIAKETNQGRRELSGATAIQEKYLKTRPEVREAMKNLTDAMFTTEVELKKDAGKEGKAVDRQKEAIRSMVGSLEKGWTSTYGKKKKPLNETELARWNELKERLVNGDMGEVTWKSSDRGYGGRYSSDLLEEMNGMHKKVTGRSFMTNDDNSAGKNIYWAAKRLQDAEDRLKEATSSEVKTGRTRSSFMNEAIDLDGTSKGDYYTQPEEMFARAFESYVHDKLEASGRRSDYLIGKGKTDNRVYRAFGMPGPFPEGDERKKINAAFDNLFDRLRGNELKAAEKKSSGTEKYSRTSYNVAASEVAHQIVDRYCQFDQEQIPVDKYAHPLIHAAVGAGAMALANKAFKSGPMRSVAHAAIAAAMSAWMTSAMAANGIPPAQGPSSPAVSAPATPGQIQKVGNNAVNQIVQNAITQHAANQQAAATAPPSPAQASAHSISAAAAGKAGVPGVRPLAGTNAGGVQGRVQVAPVPAAQSQSAGKGGVRPLRDPGDSGGGNFSNSEHPRHPAGSPQSKGGEFAPKGGAESGGSSAPEPSSSPADSSPRNYPDNLNKPASEQTNYFPPERAIEPAAPKSQEELYRDHLAKIAATKTAPAEERQSRKAAWEQTQQGAAQKVTEQKEAKKAEKQQAKQMAKATSFNPDELEAESSQMIDDIESAGEAPKEDDFASQKEYEKALEKHNRSAGAKQGSIKRRANANLIPEIAGEHDLDHDTLRSAVNDEIAMSLPYHKRKEEARQYISKMGWNSRRIDQAEDRGIDSSSTQFDDVASEWAGLFPEIAGSDESEWVAKMWELSKEGAQPAPSAGDEDLVRRVAKRLADSGGQFGPSSSPADEGDEEGFIESNYNPDDPESTPFSRSAVVGLIVDRYMRMAGIC